jgi:hypothetical protein
MLRKEKPLTFKRFAKIMKKKHNIEKRIIKAIDLDIELLWSVLKDFNPKITEGELEDNLKVMRENGFVFYK